MEKSAKIIVTIVIVIAWLLLNGLLTAANDAAGRSTPGFLAMILMMAFIGALTAIWKKDKKNDNDKKDDNNYILQK